MGAEAWTARAFRSIGDSAPTVSVTKDSRKSAEFVANQMNNKYEFVEVLSPGGGSVSASFWGGASER